MKTKICTKCNESKNLENFYKDSRTQGHYRPVCRQCQNKKYLENKEKILRDAKERYNPIKKKQYNLQYLKENKEKIAKQRKEYRAKNKEKIANESKKWRDNNKEYCKEYKRKYQKERLKNDYAFKIRRNVNRRINQAIKRKSNSTISYLGCEIDVYIAYMENLFTEGMCWDNYGKWHIDHIRPLASFNLLNETEQFEAFNYKNTQPLWAKDNLRKGGTWQE